MTIRVGINGFGRIGRTVLRAAFAKENKDFEIVHINDLTDTKTLAHLLKYDSVHGTFAQSVYAEDGAVVVGDQKITVSSLRNPAEIPWKDKKVDMVFECSGIFTKRADAELHMKAGAPRVLISAPATDEDITVVMGVNHQKIDKTKHKIVSNGSCTTNCLAPLAKIIHESIGIKKGLMTTIHSYTNDQSLLDFPHKDLRRARAGSLSMIPTSTGAAKAIGLVMPELKGKMHGMSMRVPTPNVSVVDVTFELARNTTAEEVNKLFKDAANGPMKGILAYTDEPLVSIDFNGNTNSSIIDGLSTTVLDGNMLKVLSWYDNETGFSWRMLDLARALM